MQNTAMASATQAPRIPPVDQPTEMVTSDIPQLLASSSYPNNVRRMTLPLNAEPSAPRVTSTQLPNSASHRTPTTAISSSSVYSPAPSQPSPSQGLIGRPRNRPAIMDPPGNKISSPTVRGGGFPSPSVDHASINPKFVDDLARITYAIQQSLGDAVRRAIRDSWEKCLLGTDFHQAFVLNASIHHATVPMTKRAIRDFGSKMVKAGKEDLIEHFSQADLDTVADTILAKASHSFLDKALELRLRTIEAKPLVDALSRAERLGYDSNDVVEQVDNHQERVIPSDSPPAAHRPSHPANYVPAGGSAPRAPGAESAASWQCTVCYRTFTQESAYNHHMRKQVCTHAPAVPEGFRYSCSHCGQGFSTAVGLQYHLNNKVCGDFGPTPAEQGLNSTAVAAAGAAAAAATVRARPAVPSLQTQLAPYASTPTSQRTAAYSSATPPATSTPDASIDLMGRTISGTDPYAHLTMMQREALQEELRQAEIAFADRFKAAEAIPDLNERRVRIDSLRNGFGTKQSMIRKKYGVRLRERRTKKEIEAERERMGRQNEERYDRSALDDARKSLTAIHGGVPRPPGPGRPPTNYVTTTIPVAKPAATGSWTAANTTNGSITAKRELDVDSSPNEGDPKRRRVEGEAANKINGFTGSVQRSDCGEQSGHEEQALDVSSESKSPSSHESDSDSSVTLERQLEAEAIAAQRNAAAAIAAAPATVPSAQPVVHLSEDDHVDQGSSDDSDEDDDEDIPAVLPAAMRQGLSQTSQGISNT